MQRRLKSCYDELYLLSISTAAGTSPPLAESAEAAACSSYPIAARCCNPASIAPVQTTRTEFDFINTHQTIYKSYATSKHAAHFGTCSASLFSQHAGLLCQHCHALICAFSYLQRWRQLAVGPACPWRLFCSQHRQFHSCHPSPSVLPLQPPPRLPEVPTAYRLSKNIQSRLN